ncbi:MAG: hypothetical protein J0M30_14755 [Chitinophagales bacterium]|nr:hypothetical protein [Chitinophagales bacterium]
MKATIKYTDSAIVITLPCVDPAATHASLLNSIAANVEYSSQSEDKHKNFGDEVTPLIELLRSILPDENQLRKAFS